MPITAGSSGLQNAISKGASTSLAFASSRPDAVAGAVIIVAVSCDNLTVTTPTVTLSKAAGETANWAYQTTDSPASAGTGVRGTLGIIKTTVPWTSHVITATFSASVAAKVMVSRVMLGADTTWVQGPYRYTGASTSGWISYDAALPGGVEDGTIIAWFTENATWPDSAQPSSGAATSGGSAATNAGVTLWHGNATSSYGAPSSSALIDGGHIAGRLAEAGTTPPVEPPVVLFAGWGIPI